MADFDPLQCATPYPSEEAPLCHIFEGSSESHTSTLCGATYYPDLCAILCKAFNLNDWRPGQLAACVAAMEQKDVLVTLPTGSGKSLCYQLPAVYEYSMQRKMTVVVVPLVSLMKDQLSKLLGLNLKAFGYFTGLDRDIQNMCDEYLSSPCRPKPIFLFLTPEGLFKVPKRLEVLKRLHGQGKIARIVIDEVQEALKGPDFRPDLDKLKQIRESFPKIPLTLLSGSCGTNDIYDTISCFQISGCYLVLGDSDRSNLFYRVLDASDVRNRILSIIKSHPPTDSGLVYTRSKGGCVAFARMLRKKGIRAEPYHGEMKNEEKARVTELWKSGEIQYVVATNAFGLGIDKPDVRWVFHKDVPKDMNQYLQETGRAGRDGKYSECIMFYCYSDVHNNYTLILRNFRGQSLQEKMTIPRGSYSLVNYCEDTTTCRRTHIMRHYGIVPKEGYTCDSCDVCCMSEHTSDIVADASILATKILCHIERDAERQWGYTVDMLSNKICEATTKDLEKNENLGFQPTKANCKRVIVQLILSHHLEEYPNPENQESSNIQWYIRLKRPVRMPESPFLVNVTGDGLMDGED